MSKNEKTNLSRVQVFLRIRPLNKNEQEISNIETVQMVNDQIVVLENPEKIIDKKVLDSQKQKQIQFVFDQVFNQNKNQFQIYEFIQQKIFGNLIKNISVTLFAYGNTSAGVIPRTLKQLFMQFKNSSQIKISFLEIYNETLLDLLTPSKQILEILEDENGQIKIANLTRVNVNSAQEIMSLLNTGIKRRKKESTLANEVSSRSHAILQIQIFIGEMVLNLNLIDLAGSERAAFTNNKGMRLREGANINKSLLALGNCINSLAKKKRANFIGFRDSKLTRILKDSFMGNYKTFIIANVTPSVIFYEDTLNTMKYMTRAMNIKTKLQKIKLILPKKQKVQKQNDIKRLKEKIQQMQKENILLQKQVQKKQVVQKIELDKNDIQEIEQKIIQHFQRKQNFNYQDIDKDDVVDIQYQEIQLKKQIESFSKDTFLFNFFWVLFQKENFKSRKFDIHFKKSQIKKNIKLPTLKKCLSQLNTNTSHRLLKKRQVTLPQLKEQFSFENKNKSLLQKNAKHGISYKKSLLKSIFQQQNKKQEKTKQKNESKEMKDQLKIINQKLKDNYQIKRLK